MPSFYAGAPLTTADGLPLGMLCVLDHDARPEGLKPQQAEALTALARAVMCQLELKLASRAVAESEEFTRRLLASSDDCIKVFDLKGRLRFMSQGGMRAMEVQDFSTIEGRTGPTSGAALPERMPTRRSTPPRPAGRVASRARARR